MHVHLVFVGKTNLPEIETGIQRYFQRLQHYFPATIEVVKPEKITRKISEESVREAEGERILKLVGNQGHLIVWDQRGRQMESTALAHFWEGLILSGHKTVWMVIGGPLGISSRLLQQAHTVLSLSKMTFPHDVARLLVVEQLYRAATILKGEPYHK